MRRPYGGFSLWFPSSGLGNAVGCKEDVGCALRTEMAGDDARPTTFHGFERAKGS